MKKFWHKFVTWSFIALFLLLTYTIVTLGTVHFSDTVEPLLIPLIPGLKPSRLEMIRQRGYLRCGVSGFSEGFSEQISVSVDPEGFYENAHGFDADFCRVVAIAIFGKHTGTVRFKNLTTEDRYAAIISDVVDIVFRNSTWTPERDVIKRNGVMGIDFGPTIFYTYQTFIAPISMEIQTLQDLKGKTVCVLTGSTHEKYLETLRDLNILVIPRTSVLGEKVATFTRLADLFFESHEKNQAICDVITSDHAQLSMNLQKLPQNEQERYTLLNFSIADEPLAPIIPENDSQWREIISYAIWATIHAEELGISQQNLLERLNNPTLLEKVFLGIDDNTFNITMHIGEHLGLDNDFAYKIIDQMGNYGEIYERHWGKIIKERSVNQVPIRYLEGKVGSNMNSQGRLFSPPWAPDAVQIASGQGSTTTLVSPLKVRIGIAIAQSQQDNPLGLDQLAGVQIAKEYFKSYLCDNPNPGNEQSPKSRFCIDLETNRDTRGDNETAVSVFKTLIYTDGVAIIIGPTYSEQAQYAHPIADDAQVPVIAVSNTAAGIPEIGWFVSRVSAPVAVYAPFALYDVQSRVERVAVIYRDNDKFTLSETHAFTQAITASDSGLTLVATQPYTSGASYKTVVSATLAMSPELVIVSGRFKDGYSIIQELRKQGFVGTGKYIIGGNGINATAIFNSCGQACDGIYIAQAYNPRMRDSTIQQNFLKAHNEVGYEGLPSQITAQMFTALQVVIEALVALEQKPGFESLSLEQLRVELNTQLISSGMQFDSVLGPIWFDKKGEVCQEEFYVARIDNPDGNSGQFKIDPTPRTVPLSDRNGCYREFLGQP